jgi:hypothetical protein
MQPTFPCPYMTLPLMTIFPLIIPYKDYFVLGHTPLSCVTLFYMYYHLDMSSVEVRFPLFSYPFVFYPTQSLIRLC